MRMAARLQAMDIPKYQGLTRKSGDRQIWTGAVTLDEVALDVPKKWRKPKLIFVNSMSDLFQDAVPIEFIRRVWETMAATPQHTYQILTKRPDRMALVTPDLPCLQNVWLGTSIENAAVVGRLDHLRETIAALRFVSFEPLIGSIAGADLKNIDWAIVGGESGPRARPMSEEWVEEIFDLCSETNTAFFFKQWGGTRPKSGGRLLRGREWNHYPHGWNQQAELIAAG
jgi:protein gp37